MANAYLYNAQTTSLSTWKSPCAEEAFAILAKLSQDTNLKLRDVAAALVERSTIPKR